MDTNKIREQFETAYAARSATRNGRFHPEVFTRGGDGEYVIPLVQSAWWGWQSSRDAVVVELPADDPLGMGAGDCEGGRPSFEQHCAAECNAVLGKCREALEAQGVSVRMGDAQ